MSYDAYVPCACVHDGLTPEPPNGIVVSIDECGVVDVRGPDVGQAIAWSADACEHPDFELAQEHISNIAGMVALREAVHRLGDLPVLATYLPVNNGGCIPSDRVRDALGELDSFRKRAAGSPLTRIVDGSTGEVLHQAPWGPHGIFAINGTSGIQMGYDRSGFFIEADVAERPAPRWPALRKFRAGITHVPGSPRPPNSPIMVETFRAVRVRQEPVGGRDSSLVRFINEDTGNTYVSAMAFTHHHDDASGRLVERIPPSFRVESIPRPEDWFDFVLDPIRRLLDVAQKAKSSVVWA